MNGKNLAIVLAAGEGTRMRSSLPKVMHEVAGLPMVLHVLETVKQAGCEELAVVAGKGIETVSKAVSVAAPNAVTVEQKERLGTGHAVLAARSKIEEMPDNIIVLFGDTPLLTAKTLGDIQTTLSEGNAVAVLGFVADDPAGYGRLLEKDGKLMAIREHKDATEEEKGIRLCNGGIMGLRGDTALELLDAIENNNANEEYYLTDTVEIAVKKGLSVKAVTAPEAEVMGVNTREDLAEVEKVWQQRKRSELMQSGVTFQAPETVFLNSDTEIEADVTLEPNIVFGPGVSVRTGATIRAFSHLEGAEIGSGAVIGPYARLRPGTKLAEKTKVGNFVEVKNAKIAAGAKVNHLSYIGDAVVGSDANIGAGTITCNYDGMNKHLTEIGARAFIGSNSALVAPVSIGDGAYVASGSVITESIPTDGLGIARGQQATKEGRARDIREKNKKIKQERQAAASKSSET